jgi:hypothetical protein
VRELADALAAAPLRSALRGPSIAAAARGRVRRPRAAFVHDAKRRGRPVLVAVAHPRRDSKSAVCARVSEAALAIRRGGALRGPSIAADRQSPRTVNRRGPSIAAARGRVRRPRASFVHNAKRRGRPVLVAVAHPRRDSKSAATSALLHTRRSLSVGWRRPDVARRTRPSTYSCGRMNATGQARRALRRRRWETGGRGHDSRDRAGRPKGSMRQAPVSRPRWATLAFATTASLARERERVRNDAHGSRRRCPQGR